jgi:hypothetical protein
VGGAPLSEIDQLGGLIVEWPHFAYVSRWESFLGSAGRVRAKVAAVEPREPLCNQCVNECPEMITCVLGYVFSMPADLLRESIDRVLPVEELPYVDTGRAQAKPTARVGVKKNGPVVKLLPEHDVRVGYGFFTVFHGSIFSFTPNISPDRATLVESTQRQMQSVCQDTIVFYITFKTSTTAGCCQPRCNGSH